MATISKYETTSGATLYRVRYRTPDHRQTDKRGFKTKRAAEAFANTVEVKKLTGEFIPETAGRITVGELAPAWLRLYVRAGDWRGPFTSYRRRFRHDDLAYCPRIGVVERESPGARTPAP